MNKARDRDEDRRAPAVADDLGRAINFKVSPTPANIGKPWNRAVSAYPSSWFCWGDFADVMALMAAFPLTWFNAGHDSGT